MGAVEPSERSQSRARGSKWECTPYNHELVQEVVAYMRQFETKNKWVCSSNGRVIPSQGIGNGIDARLIHLFFFIKHAIHFIFCKALRIRSLSWENSVSAMAEGECGMSHS